MVSKEFVQSSVFPFCEKSFERTQERKKVIKQFQEDVFVTIIVIYCSFEDSFTSCQGFHF